MHTLLLLASTLAAAPEWTLLAFPRATRASDAAPIEALFLDAAHLDVTGGFRTPALEVPEPAIPGAIFQQMLDETLRQRGFKLETRPQAGLLLARGDAAALEVARALITDLDRQTAAFEIDLEVTIEGFDPTARDAEPRAAKWRRRVQAGTELFLGSRTSRPFIAGFDVQVAQDAGQAEPQLGAAHVGRGLHLRATRLAGGTRVFLDGVLDASQITRVESFDPETVDAGVFEQPQVELAQIAFAGVVESGGTLEVRLQDPALGAGKIALGIRATARPDAAPSNDGWALVDLGFSSLAPRPLIAVEPGVGISDPGDGRDPGGATLTPAALAALLEADRGGADARGARALMLWTRSILAIPRSDAARVESARALVRATEESRATTQRVEIVCGPVQASFPVAAGRLGRLVVGSERPYLTDYGLEVAPQIWMPTARVERAFDGISAEIALEGGVFGLDAWRTTTPEVVVATRESAQMGRLQLPIRTRVAGRARLAAGEPPVAVFDEGAPLTLSSSTP